MRRREKFLIYCFTSFSCSFSINIFAITAPLKLTATYCGGQHFLCWKMGMSRRLNYFLFLGESWAAGIMPSLWYDSCGRHRGRRVLVWNSTITCVATQDFIHFRDPWKFSKWWSVWVRKRVKYCGYWLSISIYCILYFLLWQSVSWSVWFKINSYFQLLPIYWSNDQ